VDVTLKQIQAFLAVAELGSFTRAAERLHVAQPALSQYVRDLEAELGIKLFDRTTRKVELTEGGIEFRSAAAKSVEDLDHAVRNARDLASRRRGRLIVAAPPLLAAVILPRVISDFVARYPGVQIIILDARTDQIVDRVRTGQADCGIGTFAPSEAGIDRTTLARDSLLLFCSHESPFVHRTQVRWSDLRDQPLVTLTRDSGIRLLVERGYDSAQLPMRPDYEVSHIGTAIALVEVGLGVAVLPTYAFAAAHDRKVVARPLIEPTIARNIFMISPSGRSAPPALPAFATILRKHTRALVPRNSGPP